MVRLAMALVALVGVADVAVAQTSAAMRQRSRTAAASDAAKDWMFRKMAERAVGKGFVDWDDAGKDYLKAQDELGKAIDSGSLEKIGKALESYEQAGLEWAKRGPRAAQDAFDKAQPNYTRYGGQRLKVAPDGQQLYDLYNTTRNYARAGRAAYRATQRFGESDEQGRAPAADHSKDDDRIVRVFQAVEQSKQRMLTQRASQQQAEQRQRAGQARAIQDAFRRAQQTTVPASRRVTPPARSSPGAARGETTPCYWAQAVSGACNSRGSQ